MNYNMPYQNACYNPMQQQLPICPCPPIGFQGPQGFQGAQGVQGVIGLIGQQGPRGLDGTQGIPGTNGAQGPIGFQGLPGNTGATGLTGPQGLVGGGGFQGPNGNSVTGPQGPPGLVGATGTQGPTGNTGPLGNDGSNSGIWVLDSVTSGTPTLTSQFTTDAQIVSNITTFKLNILSLGGNDYSTWLASLITYYQSETPVYFQLIEREANYTIGVWEISAIPINNGSYFTLPVKNIMGQYLSMAGNSLTIGKRYTLSWVTHGLPSPCNLRPYQGSDIIPENTYNIDIINTISPVSSKWIGGVLASNCKLYYVPFNANEILVVDTETNTTSTISVSPALGKWAGGVVSPNGNIYMIPFNNPNVVIIDPYTNALTVIFISNNLGKYLGGVLGPDGKIYCIPYNEHNILVIDTLNSNALSFITFTPVGTQSSALYAGGVLGLDGKIYCVPWSSDALLIIDTQMGTVSQILSPFIPQSVTGKWAGGALGPNGNICFTPYNYATILVITPSITPTITPINITQPLITSSWFGAVLGQNGKIYCIPAYESRILEIDSSTFIFSLISVSALTGTTALVATNYDKYRGGVLASNGKIYSVPYVATDIMILNTDLPTETKWMYAPEFNKF